MQLSGCWLERDLRLLDLSVFVVGSRLTFRGFPSVTRADAIASPAETTSQHSISDEPTTVYHAKLRVEMKYNLVIRGGTTAVLMKPMF